MIYLLVEHVRLDADFAGDVLAWIILSVFDSIETNWAKRFVIESRLFLILHLFLDCFIVVNRVIADLFAHN